MARPVRIDVAGGWHRVTARGSERREILLNRRAHEHVLDLPGDMARRYEVRLKRATVNPLLSMFSIRFSPMTASPTSPSSAFSSLTLLLLLR